MTYVGSKRRMAKHIVPLLLNFYTNLDFEQYVEPFVGGANLIDKLHFLDLPKKGYDINHYVIAYLKAIRDGWIPPYHITSDEYEEIKEMPENYSDELVAYANICFSFGAVWGATYAKYSKNDNNSNRLGQAQRNALKQAPLLKNIEFESKNYKELSFENSLIYCDPPYKSTITYKNQDIDHEEFYNWCREQNQKNNTILVSEYDMPADFINILSNEICFSLTNISNSSGKKN